MYKFEILADTTCDISVDLQKKYGIKIVPGTVVLPDGREVYNNLQWDFMSREDFYAAIKNKNNVFSTSCPNYDVDYKLFESILKEGKDILVINISSSMSGTYGFSLKAANDLKEKYPDRKIYVVDSLRYSTAFGTLCVQASILREKGYDIDYVAKWVEDNKNLVHQMGYNDDLTFLANKGRINKVQAFFGAIIGIKALGDINSNGMTTVLGKVKGKTSAFKAIIRYIEETIVSPNEQIIFIAQTNHIKEAEELKELINDKFHPQEIIINDVYASCGVNIGPGLLACYYYGKPYSKDLEEEKKIIDNIIREK